MSETCEVFFAGNDTQRAKSENDIILSSGGGGGGGIVQIGRKLWTPQTGGGSPVDTTYRLAPDDEPGQSMGFGVVSRRLEVDAVFGDMTTIQNGTATMSNAGVWYDVPLFSGRFPIRWVTSIGDELSGDTTGSFTIRAWVQFSATNWTPTNEGAHFRVTLYKGVGIAGSLITRKVFNIASTSLLELSGTIAPFSVNLANDYITLRYECGYFSGTPS